MTEAAQLRVIVCDDDINIRSYMTAMLKAMGIGTVIEAEAYPEVISAIESNGPIHGVFQDLVLQRGSGLDIGRVCQKYKIPVVFCSGVDDEYNMSQMLEIGWVLRKPVRLAGLQRAIEYFQCLQIKCKRPDCELRT